MESKYKVSARVIDITANTKIMPENNFGGWLAVNTGTAAASVMGYELQPGEGLDFTQAVPAGSIWDTPIEIRINTGAVIRLTRLQCKEIKSVKISGK